MPLHRKLLLASSILFLGTTAATTVLVVVIPAYLCLNRSLYYTVLRVYVGASEVQCRYADVLHKTTCNPFVHQGACGSRASA